MQDLVVGRVKTARKFADSSGVTLLVVSCVICDVPGAAQHHASDAAASGIGGSEDPAAGMPVDGRSPARDL